ncbi:MAG: hypothetical protein ACE5EM_01575 [Sphingomonadales bacterium]
MKSVEKIWTKLIVVSLLAMPLTILSACGDQGGEEQAATPDAPAASTPAAGYDAAEAIKDVVEEATEATGDEAAEETAEEIGEAARED